MAELLTTKEILVALDNIIKHAEKYICIFTFNIKIDENYLSRLRNASKRGVQINIIFGVGEGRPDVISNILSIPNCKVYFKEYLHAKFFYNEKELLVGSMNLSEASAKNNYELAVLFKGQDYSNVIEKVKREAKEIIEDSKPWNQTQNYFRTSEFKEKPKVEIYTNRYGKEIVIDEKIGSEQWSKPKAVKSHKQVGFCIRCKASITLDHVRPLCIECYTEWADWENDDYPENFDHYTGEKSKGQTTKALPILSSNWKKYTAVSGKK